MGRPVFRWGWCGEGCPLRGSTWGTDRTLTVTTHTVFVFDLDIYIVPGILILLALFLFSFTKKFNRHGTLGTFIFLKKKIWDNVFPFSWENKKGHHKRLKVLAEESRQKGERKEIGNRDTRYSTDSFYLLEYYMPCVSIDGIYLDKHIAKEKEPKIEIDWF